MFGIWDFGILIFGVWEGKRRKGREKKERKGRKGREGEGGKGRKWKKGKKHVLHKIRVRRASNGLTNHPGGNVYRRLLMHTGGRSTPILPHTPIYITNQSNIDEELRNLKNRVAHGRLGVTPERGLSVIEN